MTQGVKKQNHANSDSWIRIFHSDCLPEIQIGYATDEVLRKDVDGASMRSLEEFYAELSRVMEFPSYFGGNLAALEECMLDEASKHTKPFVLRIFNADQLLSSANASALHGVLSTFASVAKSWAEGVDEGEEWGSQQRKFFLVLEYA